MKLFFKAKDGGEESTVTGYWLIESKRLFSICLLKFDGPSRQAYHSHAFNCASIILKGILVETMLDGKINVYSSFKWFKTKRTDFHKVDSWRVTWLFTIRGPWVNVWDEFIPKTKEFLKLTHGRKIIK
jgi:hypothetical protein